MRLVIIYYLFFTLFNNICIYYILEFIGPDFADIRNFPNYETRKKFCINYLLQMVKIGGDSMNRFDKGTINCLNYFKNYDLNTVGEIPEEIEHLLISFDVSMYIFK